MMLLTKDFQWNILLLNLAWFLLYEIAEKFFTRQAVITTLHWWLQPSQRSQISSIDVNWTVFCCNLLSLRANLRAKRHSKNKWKEDSEWMRQLLQIERMLQTLVIKFSSVGSLPCISLQTIRDFEGGISTLHIVLAQWDAWPWGDLCRNSSLKVRSPELDRFQTNLSSLCGEGSVTWLTIWLIFGYAACTEKGTFRQKFEMKSLTFSHSECKVFWGKFKEIKRGVPHQGSFQKLIFSPSPTSQDTLLDRTWNSLLMLLHREEKIW